MFQLVRRNTEEGTTVHWKLPLFDGEESGIARDPAGLDAVQSFGGVRRIFAANRLLRGSAATCAVLPLLPRPSTP